MLHGDSAVLPGSARRSRSRPSAVDAAAARFVSLAAAPPGSTSARASTRTAASLVTPTRLRPSAARRPELLLGLLLVLLGRPDLVARLRLLDGDRLRRLDHQVHRLPHCDVLAQRLVPALLLGAIEGLLQ